MVAALKWKGASEPPAPPHIRHRMLVQAAENGDCATIRQLVSQGVPVDAETEAGVTGLMRASVCGQLSAVCELLDLGASVNKCRRDGFTPLMLAAFFGHEDVVKELLKRGADSKATTKRGTSVMMWAASRGLGSMVRLLRTADIASAGSKLNNLHQYAGEQLVEPRPANVEPETAIEPAPAHPVETRTAPVVEPATAALSERQASETAEIANEKDALTRGRPGMLSIDDAPNDWSICDGLTGEGIRRIGPPEAEPRYVSPWEKPLTNVAPFSPFAALGDRFGKAGSIASAAVVLLLVAGLVVAASWRWRQASQVQIAPVTVPSKEDNSKPVTSVESEPAAKPDTAFNREATQPTSQTQSTTPQEGTPPPPSPDAVATQPSAGNDLVRVLPRTSRTLNRLSPRQRRPVTTDVQENQSETERPAGVTVVTKDPSPPKPASRPQTDSLPPPPLGNATKKRVIQWP